MRSAPKDGTEGCRKPPVLDATGALCYAHRRDLADAYQTSPDGSLDMVDAVRGVEVCSAGTCGRRLSSPALSILIAGSFLSVRLSLTACIFPNRIAQLQNRGLSIEG
jgi:hypothetical protein